MSDPVAPVEAGPSPQNLPGIPEEKSNEQSPEIGVEAKAPHFEKLGKISRGVFEHAGVIFKRGLGRSRKDGAPKKSDIPLNATPTNLPIGVAPLPSDSPSNLDPSLVKRCIAAMVKAVDGVLGSMLSKKLRQANYSAGEAKQFIIDNAITQSEADSFSDLALVCLQKYGVGTAYAPEIGLIVIATGIGVRYATAFATINRDIEARMTQPQAANGN